MKFFTPRGPVRPVTFPTFEKALRHAAPLAKRFSFERCVSIVKVGNEFAVKVTR